MQQQVYPNCSIPDCNRALTEDELVKHEAEENFYFTICDQCLQKSTERVLRIMGISIDKLK